jgi:hypothetical protein
LPVEKWFVAVIRVAEFAAGGQAQIEPEHERRIRNCEA